MNRRERRKQVKVQRRLERAARRRGQKLDVYVCDPKDTQMRARLVGEISSPRSMAVFASVLTELKAWRAANPDVELEWVPHPPAGSQVVIGPLDLPEAQRHLAKNDAAVKLLAHLAERAGPDALTIHAMVALEELDFRPPPPHRAKIPRPTGTIFESAGARHVREYEQKAQDTHRIPQSACPGCGAPMEFATASEGAPTPKAGDPGICVGCGTLVVFDERLCKRRMTAAEFAEFDPEQRQELEEVSAIYRARALSNPRRAPAQA